jgi:Carboxypeptidase regulatory-like domain
MLKRTLLASLLAIVLSACAAGPAIFGTSTGTVNGHVMLRACGGANLEGQSSCPTRPMARATVSFRLTATSGTPQALTAVTDATGAYSVKLAPGTYTMTLTATGDGVLGSSHPSAAKTASRQVTVTAGKTVTADLTYIIQLL